MVTKAYHTLWPASYENEETIGKFVETPESKDYLSAYEYRCIIDL